MSEIESTPVVQEDIFAQAKIADLCIIAETILQRWGNDRCTDSDFLFEARWDSSSPAPRSYELTQEIDDEGHFCYWLEVTGDLDDHYDKIGFTPETGSIDWEEEGHDSEEEVVAHLYRDEDPVTWVRLERCLYGYLRTAPGVDSESLAVDNGWQQQFEDVIVEMAADDKEFVDYLEQYDPYARRISPQHRAARKNLRSKYGFNRSQLARVLDLMMQRAVEEETDDQA